MATALLGGGISITNGGMPANPNSLLSLNPQVEVSTLDSNGKALITAPDANTKYALAGFQEASGFQGAIQRVNPSNTTQIEVQADAQTEVENKTVAVIYWG